ncbi:MAG: uroporphyrinogen decarboxylase family protein, partial [Ruthenibacterium sp.]
SRYCGPDAFHAEKNAALGKTVSVFGVERCGIGYGQPISHPLAGASLAQIHAYPWPKADWYDVSHIREDALAFDGQYAILGGEWCPFFHDAIDLLGMENLMLLMYDEPELVTATLTHIVDFYCEVSRRIFEAAEGAIDIFFLGNDFGSQTGPLLGKELFDQFFMPQLHRLAALGHRYHLKVQLHCCGSFAPLIPSMIAAGIDALQSLQPITPDMQPSVLKATFGDRIVLNGCVDSIRVLINGTPDFVREQTLKTLTEMLSGGGFILSPSHDYLLEETPVENALAFYDTGFQYRAAISG